MFRKVSLAIVFAIGSLSAASVRIDSGHFQRTFFDIAASDSNAVETRASSMERDLERNDSRVNAVNPFYESASWNWLLNNLAAMPKQQDSSHSKTTNTEDSAWKPLPVFDTGWGWGHYDYSSKDSTESTKKSPAIVIPAPEGSLTPEAQTIQTITPENGPNLKDPMSMDDIVSPAAVTTPEPSSFFSVFGCVAGLILVHKLTGKGIRK